MSLDVYLKRKRWISYDNCVTSTEETETIYADNITHNLGKMAKEAGIYEALWRPEEIGATKAGQLIDILDEGLSDLKSRPTYFKQFDDPNGWGMYKHFVPFVEGYLNACIEFPYSDIEISR